MSCGFMFKSHISVVAIINKVSFDVQKLLVLKDATLEPSYIFSLLIFWFYFSEI